MSDIKLKYFYFWGVKKYLLEWEEEKATSDEILCVLLCNTFSSCPILSLLKKHTFYPRRKLKVVFFSFFLTKKFKGGRGSNRVRCVKMRANKKKCLVRWDIPWLANLLASQAPFVKSPDYTKIHTHHQIIIKNTSKNPPTSKFNLPMSLPQSSASIWAYLGVLKL